MASGLGGIFTQPIRGARSEGAVGFLKGAGVGLWGAVVKPTAGVVGLAARAAEGASNTPGYFGNDLALIRPQRCVSVWVCVCVCLCVRTCDRSTFLCPIL